MDELLRSYGAPQVAWTTALLACLSAFVLASVIAQVYAWTYEGLSWSRSLVQALVLGSVVACVLMLAIGDNLARGVGIVGSLAIIRFRTNLRDPKDMIFVFAALGVGVASGVGSYAVALVGTLVFGGVSVALWGSGYGSRRDHDGVLRFQAPRSAAASEAIAAALRAEGVHAVLITTRAVGQGEWVDLAYQVTLGGDEDLGPLLARVEAVEGVRGVAYVNQQATVEV